MRAEHPGGKQEPPGRSIKLKVTPGEHTERGTGGGKAEEPSTVVRMSGELRMDVDECVDVCVGRGLKIMWVPL